MIVDYPWSHPGGGALKAAGVKGALRYLSHDVTKTLLRPEADDLAAHGIPMAVVFEDMATRALDGYTAGANDAQVAVQMTKGQRSGYTDLAMPSTRPIYFASDFDGQWPQVAQYYAGAASVLGKDRVGVYGGRAVIEGAANSGYTWLWQAYAWSNVGALGWYSKALLHQELATTTINGVDCDVNNATVSDWGQWFPGEGDIVLDAQTLDQIVQAVWNHEETDAWDNKPVRFGSVMAWMDKIHGDIGTNVINTETRIAGVEAKLDQLLALMKADKS